VTFEVKQEVTPDLSKTGNLADMKGKTFVDYALIQRD